MVSPTRIAARTLPLAAVFALLASRAGAAERTYLVIPAESALTIQVGRSGLFSFAGHEHEVVAPAFDGRIVADPEALERSSVKLRFEAGALRVTGRGEPAKDVPEVQEAMLGPKVLDVARFPAIAFESVKVAGRALSPLVYELQLDGELELRGIRRSLSLPLRVELSDGVLTAAGRAKIRQSQFGIKPISVAGVVKVKDELGIDFRIVAHAQAN